MQLDGALSANGSTGPGFNSGGGAGGSIQVTTKTLSGAGTISAIGGAANDAGGGGGGGRIAINYTSNSFAGGIFAYGGAGAHYGGAGTIYQTGPVLNQLSFPQVTIDNNGTSGAVTLISSLTGTYNLTITGGASVSNSISSTMQLVNLLVGSNCVLQASTPGGNQSISAMTNITVQAGGSINADGLAVSSQGGIGQTLNSTGGGGGSAGTGGNSLLGALGGNASSDLVTSPTIAGGRGGPGSSLNGQQPVNGGNGGGVLRITAGRTLRLDGRISVEGGASPSFNGGGGGAGVLTLSCKTFSGSGTISANGGAGNGIGGGGGGGRIAI